MSDFSVIVPVYYGKNYIPGIIRQIEVCRGYLERGDFIEVLFVNDAPKEPIDLKWESKIIDIKVINSDQNIGIHGTRLKGLAQCRGEYVLFLDQDDRIKPEYFRSQMRNLGNGDAVICKALNGGRPIYSDTDDSFLNLPFKQFALKERNVISSPGQVLLKRESIPDAWIKNVMQHNGADDWFLWICMYAEERRISLNEEILYEHILQGKNTSNDVIGMLRSEQEMLRIILEEDILSEFDFKLLLEGLNKSNFIRTRELFTAKKKLDLIDRWMVLRKKHVLFSEYLNYLKIQTIAVYGCGFIGEYLYEELKAVIGIKYFIDKNARNLYKEIPVYTLMDSLPKVDSVVITLMDETECVEQELIDKGFKNIIILKDWLMNV